jgi:hypothetical protein
LCGRGHDRPQLMRKSLGRHPVDFLLGVNLRMLWSLLLGSGPRLMGLLALAMCCSPFALHAQRKALLSAPDTTRDCGSQATDDTVKSEAQFSRLVAVSFDEGAGQSARLAAFELLGGHVLRSFGRMSESDAYLVWLTVDATEIPALLDSVRRLPHVRDVAQLQGTPLVYPNSFERQ